MGKVSLTEVRSATDILGPGAEIIGNMGGITKTIQMTPVLTVAGLYSDGDFVGTSGAAIAFANAGLAVGKGGLIESAILTDYAAQNASIELWLFTANVTPPADNAAWTITDAHALTCIGVITFDIYKASAANSVSPQSNLGLAFNCAAAATTIYGCLVTRTAKTWATGELSVSISILQDAG